MKRCARLPDQITDRDTREDDQTMKARSCRSSSGCARQVSVSLAMRSSCGSLTFRHTGSRTAPMLLTVRNIPFLEVSPNCSHRRERRSASDGSPLPGVRGVARRKLSGSSATLPCTGRAAVLAMRISPSRMPRSANALARNAPRGRCPAAADRGSAPGR